MTQKNSENIYKALKEEERTLLEKNVTWMEKAFKRKEGYVTFGNAGGELVFCEGEFLSYLEGSCIPKKSLQHRWRKKRRRSKSCSRRIKCRC